MNPQNLRQNRIKAGMCIKHTTFSIVIDDTIERCKEKWKNLTVVKWKMKDVTLQELLSTDDIVAETEAKLQ